MGKSTRIKVNGKTVLGRRKYVVTGNLAQGLQEVEKDQRGKKSRKKPLQFSTTTHVARAQAEDEMKTHLRWRTKFSRKFTGKTNVLVKVGIHCINGNTIDNYDNYIYWKCQENNRFRNGEPYEITILNENYLDFGLIFLKNVEAMISVRYVIDCGVNCVSKCLFPFYVHMYRNGDVSKMLLIQDEEIYLPKLITTIQQHTRLVVQAENSLEAVDENETYSDHDFHNEIDTLFDLHELYYAEYHTEEKSVV